MVSSAVFPIQNPLSVIDNICSTFFFSAMHDIILNNSGNKHEVTISKCFIAMKITIIIIEQYLRISKSFMWKIYVRNTVLHPQKNMYLENLHI